MTSKLKKSSRISTSSSTPPINTSILIPASNRYRTLSISPEPRGSKRCWRCFRSSERSVIPMCFLLERRGIGWKSYARRCARLSKTRNFTSDLKLLLELRLRRCFPKSSRKWLEKRQGRLRYWIYTRRLQGMASSQRAKRRRFEFRVPSSRDESHNSRSLLLASLVWESKGGEHPLWSSAGLIPRMRNAWFIVNPGTSGRIKSKILRQEE